MSDINTVVVDSRKALDPKRPIREATKILRCRECSDVPLASFAATQKIESLFVISDSNDTSNPIITLENRSNIVSPRINPVELLFFDRADRFD